GTDLVCRPLLAAGTAKGELAALTLGEVPPSPELDRLRRRRSELGLPAGDADPLLIDPATGAAVGVDALPLHLRRARATRVGIEGQWAEAMHPTLPYTLGHENAGWVHEVGPAVTNVAVGDTVILHPTPTCGLCRACRAGDDMHCADSSFPGLSHDGGMAEYLL